MNKFAIITGASTGIGFELASIAAENGYDLLVVADEPLIDAAARDFETHGVTAQSVEADLSTFEGVDRLLAAAEGRQIDLLCANAGHGLGRDFLGQEPTEWKHVIDTNITGTVYLLQKVLNQMVSRGEGKVLITGSIAGHVPGSFHAVYNATKAFVDNFADAIRNELKDHENIQITTLKPGATETEFFARADMLDTKVGSTKNADAYKVAKDGWDALMAGTNNITSGLMNKAQVAASGVLPPEVMADQHRKMAEPGTAE